MIVLRNYLSSGYTTQTGEFADTTALMPVDASLEPTGPDISVTNTRRFGALDVKEKSDEARSAGSINVLVNAAWDGKARHSAEVPLSPKMMTGVASAGLYLGTSDSAEIQFIDQTGRESHRFRVDGEALIVNCVPTIRADCGFNSSNSIRLRRNAGSFTTAEDDESAASHFPSEAACLTAQTRNS